MNIDFTRDIFVVAGSYKEFQTLVGFAEEQWRQELKEKRVHFVSHAHMLRGQKPARVVLFGTYYRRADWEQIDLEISIRGHRRLEVR